MNCSSSLPALIGFVVFFLVPTLRGIYLSFTEYSVLGDPEWIGSANYKASAKDALFWNAMAVTAQYVLLNMASRPRLPWGWRC